MYKLVYVCVFLFVFVCVCVFVFFVLFLCVCERECVSLPVPPLHIELGHVGGTARLRHLQPQPIYWNQVMSFFPPFPLFTSFTVFFPVYCLSKKS